MRILLIGLLLIPSLLLAMAETAGPPPEVKGIEIVVVDKSGVKHTLKSPTCEGLSYLKVKKGSLEYSISLTKIKKIEVIRVGRDKALLRIHTKDGKAEIFETSPNTFCVMQSELGNVSFTLRDVKEIIFKGEGR